MSAAAWEPKREWWRHGRDFLVTVKHHIVEPTAWAIENGCAHAPNRWNVYAYIYPKHPHFAAFDETETLFQDAATAMPLHGGPSLVRRHYGKDGEVLSIQVGCDYDHLHDDGHRERDAQWFRAYLEAGQELFDWLAARAAQQQPRADGSTQA